MEWLAKIIEFLKLPLKYVWALMLACALLLFSPDAFLKRIHAEKFLQDYGPYIGVVFLVSLLLVAVQIITNLWTRFQTRLARKRHLKRALDALTNLDAKEQAVLREFYIQNQNTLQLPIDQVTVAGLINKGVLCAAGPTAERSIAGLLMAVKITDNIKQHITYAIIGLPPEPSEADIAFVRDNRPEFLDAIEDHNQTFHTPFMKRRIPFI